MDYVTCIGLFFKTVIVSCVGDPTIYENLIWQEGDELPSQAELDAAIAGSAQADFEAAVIIAVEAYLDQFAATRGYGLSNGSMAILSACTYATSTVPQRAMEGQYCVDMRDQVWNALYAMQAAVLSGTTPMPTSIEAVVALMPVLTWPPDVTTTSSTT